MRRLCAAVLPLLAVLGLCVVASSGAAALPAARCTTSKALFRNPFHNIAPYSDTSRDAYTSLEVYQRGAWAGFAYDGVGDYMPISWRPGTKPRMLEYRRYRNISTSGYRNFTISMVGVTPSGAVIGDAQATYSHRHWAFGYLHGRRYRLHTSRRWTDVRVLAVTDAGRILGYGVTGSGTHAVEQVVSWANVNATPRALVRIGPGIANPPAADRAGDIVWTVPQTNFAHPARFVVRLPSGRIETLVSPDPDWQSERHWVAAGHYVFTNVKHRAIRWNTATTAGPEPLRGVAVTPSSYDDQVQAAGPLGRLVWGGDEGRTHVSIPGRAPVAIPGEYDAVSEAVGPYGGIAYTAAKDHLVHILTCH